MNHQSRQQSMNAIRRNETESIQRSVYDIVYFINLKITEQLEGGYETILFRIDVADMFPEDGNRKNKGSEDLSERILLLAALQLRDNKIKILETIGTNWLITTP